MSATAALQVIRDSRQAAAVLPSLRRQMLQMLSEPDSASGLARQLELPRQRVNYHLREMERAGLVEHVEDRRKGNCVERIVRARARRYLISPEALGPLADPPEDVEDRFSSTYLIAAAAKVVRDVAVLRDRASEAGKKLPTLTVETEVRFANAQSQHAFAEELSQQIAQLTAKYHDETAAAGRTHRVVLGSYPKITKDEHGQPLPTKEHS